VPSPEKIWSAGRAYKDTQTQTHSFQKTRYQQNSNAQTVAGNMRKYEIYLPLKYNDGESIESAKIVGVWDELADTFGGVTVSSLSAPYQGRWKYGGVEYFDDIIKIEIIATNDRAARRFFKEFKERLKESLQQVDILITTHGIQVI
jgi:hypothetical protein